MLDMNGNESTQSKLFVMIDRKLEDRIKIGFILSSLFFFSKVAIKVFLLGS